MTGLARLRLVALVALGSAACGGASDDVGSSGAETEPGFVAPLDTDILLAPITWSADGVPSVGTPVNLTRRPDYDHQPQFVPDG